MQEVELLIEEIHNLSEKLYQSNGDKEINNIVTTIEKVTEILAETDISKEDSAYFNVIIENILTAIEIKDWIFAGDILKYELESFIKEVFACL